MKNLKNHLAEDIKFEYLESVKLLNKLELPNDLFDGLFINQIEALKEKMQK